MSIKFLFDIKFEINECEDLAIKTERNIKKVHIGKVKHLYIISETMINLMAY